MLYWLSDQSGAVPEPVAFGNILTPLKRALDFYLHSDFVDAFPGDEVPLAELLSHLKELPHEDNDRDPV